MKKQILSLGLVLLAVFAGINSSFGQVKNPDPKVWVAPSCSGTASTPAAGVEYTYTVQIPTTYAGYDGVGGTYDWYVTQDADLLASGSIQSPGTNFTVGASNSPYHGGGTTSESIDITWTAAALATGQPFYLVIRYNEVNTDGSAGCDSENIKVYIIQPQNTFWLDINPSTDATIAGIPATIPSSFDICAATVESAKIISTTEVEYTFNSNTIYAIIHAAGYTGDWDAVLKVSGLVDDQKITSITYGASSSAWTPGTTDAMGNGDYSATLASTNGGTDIAVTIVIDNNHHEGLDDQDIKISIDGSYTAGGVTYNDKYDNTSGSIDCTDQPADADYVVETIKARPTVSPSNPASFIPSPALRP